MSLRRYVRKDVIASGLTSVTPISLLAHGGGGIPWSNKHPIIKFAFNYTPIVYSLQLPYHDKEEESSIGPYSGSIKEMENSIEKVKDLILSAVNQRYCIFIGYSMGGLFLQKLFPVLISSCHPSSLFLLIGSMPSISVTASLIQQYWNSSNWESEDKIASLEKLYGSKERGYQMLNYVKDTTSLLYLTNEERKELLTGKYSSNHIYWIHGRQEQPFPLKEMENYLSAAAEGKEKRKRLWIVECDHFTYFNSQNWPQVEVALENIIELYGRKDLLQPSSATKFPSSL